MAFDQDITYRVNIDDSNFQAKLTQMRASMDSTMGGMGGGFGGGGSAMMAMMAAPSMNLGGGIADFGSQLRPVTYTPMAMSMQPHFGMYQIQQTLGQAGLATMGPFGASLYAAGSAARGFMRGGFRGAMDAPGLVPDNISAYEYANDSARALGNRVGDAAAVGAMTFGNIAAAIPFGAAGSAVGSAMFGGAGLAAGAAGLLGGAAAMAVPAAYFSAVGDSYKENVALQEQLRAGSFRFITSDSPDVDRSRGRGFSASAQRQVASSIQEMELRDPRFGMSEYRQVLESGMQNDLFSGTQDIKGFQDKFKSLVDNVKTISATLHTSLKEGMEVIRGFRDMGVTDPGAVNQLVLRSEAMGRASGRTGMEMMAIGQQGAELFRGTGISMQRGFELNQANVQAIRQGLDQGTISREMVAQAGGELAFAQRQTASVLSSFQTTIGRGMLMAAYNQSTQSLDTDMLLKPGAAQSMMGRAAGIGAAGLMSLEARQEELISQLSPMQMRMFDVNQSSMIAKTLVGGGYTKNFEDAFIYAGRMRGKSIEEIKADIAFMKQNPEEYKKGQQAAIEAVGRQAAMEDIRNQTGSLGKVVANAFSRTFIEPASQKLVDARESVGAVVDSIKEDLTGKATISAGIRSKEVFDIAERAAGKDFGFVDASKGNTAYRRALTAINPDAADTTEQSLMQFAGKTIENSQIEVPDPNNPGRSKKINQQIVKTETGQALVFKSVEEAAAAQKAMGEGAVGLGETTVLDRHGNAQRRFLVQRASDIEAQSKAQRDMQISSVDRQNAEKIEVDEDALKSLQGLALSKERKGQTLGLEDAVRELYGDKTTFKDLKGANKAVVEKYLKKAGVFGEGALKELEEKTKTTGASSLAGLGREQLDKQFQDAQTEVFDELSGGKLGRAARNVAEFFLPTRTLENKFLGAFSDKAALANDLTMLTEGERHQVLTASTLEDQAAVQAKLASKYGKDEAKRIVDRVSSLDQATKDKVAGATDKANKAAAGIKALSESAQGAGADATAASIGNVSKDTMVEIERMSKQLIANYQTLLEYQKQLEGKMLQNR